MQKEGEVVEAGDVVCDIQTDKAVVSMEMDDEGVLAKILVQADSGTTKVGFLAAKLLFILSAAFREIGVVIFSADIWDRGLIFFVRFFCYL